MRSQTARFELLQQLAAQHEQAALAVLGRAQALHADAQRKLKELTAYQLRNDHSASTSVAQLSNQQQFLQRLRLAISQQNAAVARAAAQLEARRSDWLLRRRERMSYDRLVEKSTLALRGAESRREQRQLDEFGTRSPPLAAPT